MKMFIELLLILLVNSYCACAEFVEINTNDYSQELEAEDTNNNNNNYYIDNHVYGNNNKNEKRDVIKGPSLFSKIDASIADSDLAFENEEITGHSDLSRFYEKPHNIEDKLDDMDTWIAPNTHHLSPQLHVHKKKSFTAHAPHYHAEHASKKSTFPRHHRVRYEDVPDEVIKALYNWQLDDAQNAAKKSILGNNSIQDSSTSESFKPLVTERGLDEDDEQEDKSRRKKRRKINVLVNVKIKESPSTSSLVSLRPKTVIGEKRHFPYFYPRHRRYGIHHGTMVTKKILSEDSGSGDGSGSGMNEHVTASEEKSTSKLVTDGESEETEGSGSGHIPTTVQHVQIRVASPQEQTPVVEPPPPPVISTGGGKNDSTVLNTRNETAPKEVVQKVAQKEEGVPNETSNDQEGSADQQTDEKQGEKNPDTNNDVSEKPEESAKVAPSAPVAQQTADSTESAPKEEPTDGSENMKKKSGQEDKYETLEEVREKFKKWESKIIQRPSENAVDENNNAATKSTDADTTSAKTEDEHTEKSQEKVTEKAEESNANENEKSEESKSIEKAEATTEEKPEESTKYGKASLKSEEKPSSKTEESAIATQEVKSDTSLDIGGKNNTSEKKDESLESNATSVKPDETTSSQTKSNTTEESKDTIKSNFLSSGILITEKGDTSGDDEQQHLVKQKEPDDFVKELIGIPAKKLILKEKEESKSGAKTENKIEKEPEDGRLLSKTTETKTKSAEEAEEKFNIEEVNSKNKEHHDIPDSDMKEGAHSLNAADVASFENQVGSPDEGPSPEKTSSAFEAQDGTSSEGQTSSQVVEEKSAHQGSEQHSKQTLMANTKSIKHQTEAESVAKQVEEVSKKAEDSPKHNPSAKKKKISGAGDENEEVESPHDKAALANPLITKEANEFSNEQEKSFASAIEKIKAQEEKLKGKEIDSEIQETLSPSKKHSGSSSKKGESNMKQLKVYRHQILSEVKKIDDLISEYHKDGHSTKELSEAKVVLQQDLNLVKELEKNTKKKSIKKDKEKESERLQVMPSSAYLSSNDEAKEITHRGKSALDSKSTTKSLEREAERSEKQLEEYYFHTNSKSSVKHPKKPSLEEIHKLLKAEIKSLRQKKNGKADNQLKNIRKLVQQHLKKLISTGDIDKSAFHSLAPEIRQLGDLLKERIKSLKEKDSQCKNKKSSKFQVDTKIETG